MTASKMTAVQRWTRWWCPSLQLLSVQLSLKSERLCDWCALSALSHPLRGQSAAVWLWATDGMTWNSRVRACVRACVCVGAWCVCVCECECECECVWVCVRVWWVCVWVCVRACVVCVRVSPHWDEEWLCVCAEDMMFSRSSALLAVVCQSISWHSEI